MHSVQNDTLSTRKAAPGLSRRGFFDRVSDGLCGAAIAFLAEHELRAASPDSARPHASPPSFDLSVKSTHFAPRARSVIHICMQGGPSQVDLFDPKPALTKFDGQSPPRELTTNAVFETDRKGSLMASPFKFAQHGQCGAWISELLPHIAQVADDLAIVRSMYNVHPNHEPAIYKYQSGQTFPGHPVFGSWITYGLGTVNQNLPAYVVLADPNSSLPVNGVENWMSGYLPPLYQGTRMRTEGAPILNLSRDYSEPPGVTQAKRDLLARLDGIHRKPRAAQPVLDARLRNYELAARMQLEAVQALDVDDETPGTLGRYGIGQKETDDFGRRCLLARRLVERGVRFVQLFTKGQMWDNHRNIRGSLPVACRQTDQPVAALIQDLKQRGLLDSTLVLWGGEFGRLPMAQVANPNQLKTAGRDHGPYGFTSFMAGGGTKAGLTYGQTDELGYASVDQRVSIQDWHATILHLLGLHHHDLFVDRNGLEERLTHTFETRVVQELIA